MTPPDTATAANRLETDLVLEAVFRISGVDLRHYEPAWIGERLTDHVAALGLANRAALIPLILHDRRQLDALVDALVVKSTDLFRNPGFFRALRDQVVPYLKTFPYVRIWHAGCATGQEVYSMAIVLHEEGLLMRTSLLATDINQVALRQAATGAFPLADAARFHQHYREAGGRGQLADYYVAKDDRLVFVPTLAANVDFRPHDVTLDRPPAGIHLAICRNVLMYYGQVPRQRALRQLEDCLAPCGFLALGHKENLAIAGLAGSFRAIDRTWRIYQKPSAANGARDVLDRQPRSRQPAGPLAPLRPPAEALGGPDS